jgi:hypothetical protein
MERFFSILLWLDFHLKIITSPVYNISETEGVQV